MNSVVKTFVCSLMLLVWVAELAAQHNPVSIPPRPSGHVLDQARWLTPVEKDLIVEKLGKLYSEHDVDMYLVTLERLPPQGAETYARGLGEAWTRSPVWCVIFQVPGDPAGFHVEADGVEIEHQYIDQAVQESVRRARRENTEKERVVAAIQECSESLRFVHASQQRGVENFLKQRKKKLIDQNRTDRRKKIMIAAAAASALFFLAVIIFLIIRHRSKTFVYEFPETSWRTRFQAPHSGGSGIVVNYRGKKLR